MNLNYSDEQNMLREQVLKFWHVELYAGIKGLPKEFVEEATTKKLAEVGLSEFDSDRLSSTYSGGMKRKLSVACATVANPKIGKIYLL